MTFNVSVNLALETYRVNNDHNLNEANASTNHTDDDDDEDIMIIVTRLCLESSNSANGGAKVPVLSHRPQLHSWREARWRPLPSQNTQ